MFTGAMMLTHSELRPQERTTQSSIVNRQLAMTLTLFRSGHYYARVFSIN
jgi:hypothetical protein